MAKLPDLILGKRALPRFARDKGGYRTIIRPPVNHKSWNQNFLNIPNLLDQRPKRHLPIKRRITRQGYVVLSGYKKKLLSVEHKVIAERVLGRKLHGHESVHHRNGVKHDNRLDNLFIVSKRYHSTWHAGRCPQCGYSLGISVKNMARTRKNGDTGI